MKNWLCKITVLTLVSLHALSLTAQNKMLDSLNAVLRHQKMDTHRVNTLLNLSREYFMAGDMRKTEFYLNSALKFSYSIHFVRGQAFSYIQMGHIYEWLGRRKEALEKKLAALKLLKNTGSQEDIALGNLVVGHAYNILEENAEALQFFYNALSGYEKAGNKYEVGKCYEAIGNCNYWWAHYEDAILAYQKALEIYQELNKKNRIAECYVYLANLSLINNDYPSALAFNSSALGIYDSLQNIQGIGFATSGFAQVFQKLGERAIGEKKKDSAMAYLNKALLHNKLAVPYFMLAGDSGGLGDLHMRQGTIHTLLGNFPAASHFLDTALSYAKALQYKDNLKTTYLSLASLDSARGNYKQAFEHFKKFIIYRDSIANEESEKKNLQTKMQYEYDKKLAISKEAQDKKDVEIKKTRNLQYFVMTFITLIALAITMIALIQYRHNKQKQKANFLLQQQKEQIEETLIELKSTQSQLIQSEKMASLGQLTAGIAHEIQNPLNFVNNFSEVNNELLAEMREEIDKGNLDEVKAIADDLIANEEKINLHGKRADAIVKGMLQHSRRSNGIKEPINLNVLAEEYLRLAYHGLRAKDKTFHATLNTDYDNNIGHINIVPQDIGRAILNLITNALYALDEKTKLKTEKYEPTLSVSTRRAGDKIELKVKDNGNGIPSSILDKIFQPFFTTKPTGQGTGLGLSLAYDIVKAHGGELEVETRESVGTEFIIRLPLK